MCMCMNFSGKQHVCSRMKCYVALHSGGLKPYSKLNKNHSSILEAFFKVHLFPNKTALKELALQTGLNEKRVSRWFACKRFKTRLVKGYKHYLIERMYIHNRRYDLLCDHVLICACNVNKRMW